MEKTIPLNKVYIGMVVRDYNDVEDDPNYHRMWQHVPNGYKLVEMRPTPEWAKNWTPTKDPKGKVTEKDRWHLDPETNIYVNKEEKLGEKKVGGGIGLGLILVAVAVALWWFLLGGIRKG